MHRHWGLLFLSLLGLALASFLFSPVAFASTDFCDAQVVGEVGPRELLWDENSSVLMFLAGMTIDADGAPMAYRADDRGLDLLDNAGRPGNWWALLTDTDGEPAIQTEDDPAPGYYISTTALEDYEKDVRDPTRYVDSVTVPYIVLPRHLRMARLGDYGVVIDPDSGAMVYTIFADVGPSDHLGEASIAVARALGIDGDARHGGTQRDLVYLVFSGSGDHRPHTAVQIKEKAERLLEEWGGVKRAIACLDVSPTDRWRSISQSPPVGAGAQ